MVDYDDGKELEKLADDNTKTANHYAEAREKYAEAKLFLDIKLAGELKELRKKRSNIGYEMALLMLIERIPEIEPQYRDYINAKNEYKGLEKIMNAVSSRISLGQSLIKNRIQEI